MASVRKKTVVHELFHEDGRVVNVTQMRAPVRRCALPT